VAYLLEFENPYFRAVAIRYDTYKNETNIRGKQYENVSITNGENISSPNAQNGIVSIPQ